MGRSQRDAEVDMADGLEDPPLGSWMAEAALERWELEDLAQGKRRMQQEEKTLGRAPF